MNRDKLKKGDNFIAIIRKSVHSRTLGGEEGAGRKAFNGKVFKVKAAKSYAVETIDGHIFSYNLFRLEKQEPN